MPVVCSHFRKVTSSSGTIYHSWTTSGNYTNFTSSYDNSYGDTSTYASTSTTSSGSKYGLWQNSSSITGMNTVALKIRHYYTLTSSLDVSGNILLSYSWDGTTYYTLSSVYGDLGLDKANSNEESFTLSNFNGSTNLSNLRVRIDLTPGSYFDTNLGTTVYYSVSSRVYDIAVSVT